MPDRNAASLREERGRHVLRFERLLSHPPARVWQALTSSDELARWHPTPFEFEPAVGGRVRFAAPPGVPDWPDGEVLEFDPPRTLSYTWGQDDLRWELQERPDGCLLILSHSFGDRFKAARDAAGWELCLVALGESLDGVPVPNTSGSKQPPDGWSELNRDYEERFDIAPERATPPPQM
jgi:uncharacterized protein YndB with AHSA1/START domain